MKKELLSLVLMSSLVAPQGLLWATDTTPPTSVVPPTVTNTNKHTTAQTVKTDQQKLMELNAKIKILEAHLDQLRTQYQVAVKSGDKTTASALKDQMKTTHTALRVAFNERHKERMEIHYEMVSAHENHLELHGTTRPVSVVKTHG